MIYPDASFWKNKRVLVTGHTGFKGSWLTLWLSKLGSKVFGISLPPKDSPNLFHLSDINSSTQESHFVDIRDFNMLSSKIKEIQPEIAFHLAAQPLVLESYKNPLETFSSNVQGTANLLESLREVDRIKSIVLITTDKVYKNADQNFPYREIDTLGGHDPYSASKAASEIVIASYNDSFFSQKGVSVASARAGNVLGGGDWSSNRLIPDAIRAWSVNKPLIIRNPQSIRPWQHVLEPLAGYMRLAECLFKDQGFSGSYNFGPNENESASVNDVLNLAIRYFGQGEILYEPSSENLYESKSLTLDITKSRDELGVKSRWSLSKSIRKTIDWYKLQLQGKNAKDLCLDDILNFHYD